MTAIATLVDPLKRELAVPGTFADTFPSTFTKDLIGTLADAFAQARLDRFFPDVTLDISSSDPVNWATTPDLSDAGGALIVIYAAMRVLRAKLRSGPTSSTYKAGPVEASQSQSATLLKAELDYLVQRQNDLIAMAKATARVCSASQVDGYLARLDPCGTGVAALPYYPSVGGFFPYEYWA